MKKENSNNGREINRRAFLRWLGVGVGAGAATLDYGMTSGLLAAIDPNDNPLSRTVARDWEKIYRDQYHFDSTFDWVCSPNDTHACRVRAYVRNGIVTRSGSTYDYQKYADLYGNHATSNWNPRQCAKGYTFHRVLYGPYRLRHPMVRKGWKAWADAGFPELTPERRSEFLFDSRGEDEFVQLPWEDAFRYVARGLESIATTYSGEEGKKRLLAQGYQPEMVEETQGAGTRCVKMRGGMGLLGVIGKYGMYRLNNSLALLDTKVRGVGPDEALGGRNFSNYTWHGDQAPGHPWVHGLQTSDCDFNDLRFSKLIIMDGKNLVENKLTDSHWFIECMERGGKIVVIAPEYGPPSTKADYWIPIRPQTDTALWLGIARILMVGVSRPGDHAEVEEIEKTLLDMVKTCRSLHDGRAIVECLDRRRPARPGLEDAQRVAVIGGVRAFPFELRPDVPSYRPRLAYRGRTQHRRRKAGVVAEGIDPGPDLQGVRVCGDKAVLPDK